MQNILFQLQFQHTGEEGLGMEVVGAIIEPHFFRVLAGTLSPVIFTKKPVKQVDSYYYANYR